MQKVYILCIYSKCANLYVLLSLSYGYPMVILWLSYGKVSVRVAD